MDNIRIGEDLIRVDGKDLFASSIELMIERKALDVQGRTVWAVFSSDAKDLEGDVVKQNGWDLTRFKANPVSLYMHNPFNPPIASVPKIKKNMAARADLDGTRMSMAQFKFPDPGGYELSDITWFLIEQEILRAVSAGFIPTELKDLIRNEDGRDFYDGREINKALLLEISWGAIPMNQDSLVAAGEKAVKAGLDGGRVKALLEGDPEAPAEGKIYLPGAELGKVKADLKMPSEHDGLAADVGKKILEAHGLSLDPDDGETIDTVTGKGKEGPAAKDVRAALAVLKDSRADLDAWVIIEKAIDEHWDAILAAAKEFSKPEGEGFKEPKTLNHYATLIFGDRGQAGDGESDPDDLDQSDPYENLKAALGIKPE